MPRVFLGIGSNLGDRHANLDAASGSVAEYLESVVASSVYETDPQEVTDQPRFLNMVIAGDTTLSPEALLDAIHRIEASLGRDRSGELPKGPRTVDIDMLLYGREVRERATPILPHPRMHLRQFVLVPLLEIAPDLTDPRTGEPYAEIARRLQPQGIYLA
ncbi:2-amino-4-hydroxy-6-hydroxymethyldihydropteridine diphosphokinase [Salinispira pacifica]